MKASRIRYIKFVARVALVLTAATCDRWANAAQIVDITVPRQGHDASNQALGETKYTLHVSTREVVVEVVARDKKNRPVSDLTERDFQIFVGDHESAEGNRPVSGFRVVNPTSGSPDPYPRLSSAVLPLGGRCEIRSTVHYELAFHPATMTSGYHSFTVTTTRRHITLSYRKQFYVGTADIPATPLRKQGSTLHSDLMSAACYHAGVPASISLSAERIGNQDTSQARFLLKVLPASLGLADVTESSHHVALDYGVCTFTKGGQILDYWHFSEDHLLNPTDLKSVLADGWPESLDVPRRGRPALARFIVMEPKSGNLGSIDLFTEGQVAEAPTDSRQSDLSSPTRVLVHSEDITGAHKILALGSPVPERGAVCGDVYELPATTNLLPADFRVLNAVGAVYLNSFNASEQILDRGIPGSTGRSEWFGIDYYGQFWIAKPGKYLFVLNADDGADLYIDDRKLIGNDGIHPPQTVRASIELGLGRHSMHLPYFQGPTYVNLILQIKPPDEQLKMFDIREFSDPAQHSEVVH